MIQESSILRLVIVLVVFTLFRVVISFILDLFNIDLFLAFLIYNLAISIFLAWIWLPPHVRGQNPLTIPQFHRNVAVFFIINLVLTFLFN